MRFDDLKRVEHYISHKTDYRLVLAYKLVFFNLHKPSSS